MLCYLHRILFDSLDCLYSVHYEEEFMYIARYNDFTLSTKSNIRKIKTKRGQRENTTMCFVLPSFFHLFICLYVLVLFIQSDL